MAGATSHFVKHVPFLGRTVPILLQNENGPCPLLAICNVLLLRGHISVHADVGMISADELVQLVAERLIAANPVTDDSPRMADLQRTLSDVMGVLPQLRVGLDVNVRFQSCEDFEYTPECATFDLLGIRLLHGWLVDPEAVDVAGAVGRQSYNQLVEVLVSSPSEAPVAPSATAEAAETTASPVNPEQPDEEVPATPTAVSRTAVIRRFLDESASQLTAAGLKALRETLKENELAVFFRNNHFSVVFKHGGDALLLVTDVGFKSQPNIVWERLDSISGDTVYLNGLFTQPTASEVVPVPRTSQEEIVADSLSQNLVNPDLLLALSLQEQEAPHSAPEGPSAHGFATPAVIPPSPTDAAFDADLAAALAASVGNSAASPPPPAHLARGPTTVDDEAEYARQLELALAASRAEFTGGAAGGVPPSVVTVAPPVRAVGTVAQPSVAPAAAAPKPKPRMGTAVYQDQAAALREANEARAARQRATMTDEEFARREQAREDSLRGPSSASRQQGDKKKKDCCIM